MIKNYNYNIPEIDLKDIKFEKHGENKKHHSPIYYVLNVLLWGLFLLLITYSGLNFADTRSGYTFLPSHTCVIVSNSMSEVNPVNTYLDPNVQHIYKNDVIHTSNYASYDDINILDVLVYIGEKGDLICHRVIEKYTNPENNIQYIVTRGDANSVNDTPFAYTQVRGKVSKVVPKIGGLILFLRSWYFIMALCFSVFFILLGSFIYNLKNDKKTVTTDANKVIDTQYTKEEKHEKNK